MTITALDLYNYTKCPHRVYLDANGDQREKSDVSPFVKLLWELGLQTEQKYLKTLGDLPWSDLSGLSLHESRNETVRLMQEGRPLLYQGVLKHARYVGRPDLLVKREERPSRFGGYCYEPIDIKAGVGWEERSGGARRFKTQYAFQMLFYWMLLEQIQGTKLDVGRIINVNGDIEEFILSDFTASFRAGLRDVEQLVSGAQTSEPVLGSHCHLCWWYRRCERWVKQRADPSGLFFVGRVKFQLRDAGLHAIGDIAAMDVKQYISARKKIRGLGEVSLRRMKTRAQVMLTSRVQIRPGYTLPVQGQEIYFDIEDDPTRNVTYLFGLLMRDRASHPLTYRSYVARRPEDEEHVAREFWEFLRTMKDAVYYVYSHKERTTLKTLMERYRLDPAVFERYAASQYDLYSQLVVPFSDWPTHSYGIKQIARLVGFAWRDPDPSGANSIAWYNEYLQHPEDESLLRRILAYNEDDCRAMVAIKEFFEAKAVVGINGQWTHH